MKINPLSTTTPTGTAEINLFNSVTMFGAGALHNLPLKRVAVNIFNDQAGTLRFQHSRDGGTSWRTFRSVAVAAPAANTINSYEQNLDVYSDVRIDFVNGGVDQGAWEVDLWGYENTRVAAA